MFGNAAPTWDTLEEFLQSKHTGCELVHIRNRVAGAQTWYNIPANEVTATVERLWLAGWKINQFYYSLMAPTSKTLFQGEVQRSHNYLDLYYSTVPKPMRDSLVEGGQQCSGVRARLLLEYYLDPVSHDWLQVLLDQYPGHVVEFSTYSVCWGTIPNRNTVIWEVRNY